MFMEFLVVRAVHQAICLRGLSAVLDGLSALLVCARPLAGDLLLVCLAL